MKFTVILTSFKESETIKTAIEKIVRPNLILKEDMQLIVVAPDEETLNSAKNKLKEFPDFKNHLVLKDKGEGKPSAINLAIENANSEILILTDGDMYISENAIADILPHFENPKVAGVSGHPISEDSRETQFGYYSHLFCEAAHQKRLSSEFIPMSGYLYGIRKIHGLFPLPKEIRAEDAYISNKIKEAGFEIKYEPNAIAHVHFPKNLGDWLKQKKRSLGGNVQTSKFNAQTPQKPRTIGQDLKNALFPVKFASNPQEFIYSLMLYPLRLYLWIIIYIQHFSGNYSKGQWERIESSKK